MTTQAQPKSMRQIAGRVRAALLVGMLLAVQPAVASAHTGEGASFKHIVIEFSLWGLGLAATLALLVGVFWVRARLVRREQ